MIKQIEILARDPNFKKFFVLLSSGDRYPVPTRDHLSIPPRDEDESDPSYFIVYTNNAARIIDVRNVAAIELSKPHDAE